MLSSEAGPRHPSIAPSAGAGFRGVLFGLLYGPLAPVYDPFVAWLFMGEWERWQRTVLPLLPPTGLIVELGAGTAKLAAEAPAAANRPWLALEPSPTMLRVARRRRTALGRRGWWIVRATADRQPVSDDAASAVVSTFPGPWLFAEPTLAEVRRVLHPSGRLIVVLSGEIATHGWRRRLRRLALRLFYGGGAAPATPAEPSLSGFVGSTIRVATTHGWATVYQGSTATHLPKPAPA
jgi:ubiquinone/menaquinone biosynthesis C-methylase UbiE